MIYPSKRAKEEAKSTAVLGGLGYLAALQMPEFLTTLKEGLYNVRHAYKTGKEIATGGSEGMKSVKNLEEALAIVEAAKKDNQTAGQALESYFIERKDLLHSMVGVYRENETLTREVERLEVQLKGALKNFFELGNQVKPHWWKENVDQAIIKLYGMDPVAAVEKSERLKEFYKNVRKFYDAREQNENTVKEFCDYLAQFKQTTQAQNERINKLFPNLIERVKETYEKEDKIFKRDDKGAKMTREDLEKTIDEVAHYRGNTQQTETQVAQEVPIKPYDPYNWVDAVTNPVILGLAGALMVKGASKLLPHPIDRNFTRLTASPINAALYFGKKTGKATAYVGKAAGRGVAEGAKKIGRSVKRAADKLIKRKSPSQEEK